jgi:3-hydroxyisobutyrate dehydrogenase-like beta-hydroxyacid dehydrogenase
LLQAHDPAQVGWPVQIGVRGRVPGEFAAPPAGNGVVMSGVPVGFVGLGTMGLPMAGNLARAGFDVLAWNRTASVAERARARGCRTAGSPAEVAAAAPTVLAMLPDLPEVREVLGGPRGLLAPGSVLDTLVLMGTASPAGVERLSLELASRGVAVVDAPVSGGEQGACAAALSIMVGGEPAVVERVRPYLEAMGSLVRHLGPVGTGSLAKACNQLVIAGTLAALAEGVLLGERGGLAPDDLLEVLGAGLAASEVLAQKRRHLASGDFAGSGLVRYIVKDLGFALERAAAEHVALPVTEVVARLYTAVADQGLGELDNSVVLDMLRRLPPTLTEDA